MTALESGEDRIGCRGGFRRLLRSAVDFEDGAAVTDERLDPRRDGIGHSEQLQGVAGGRRVQHDRVVGAASVEDEVDHPIEQRDLEETG